MKLYSPGEHIKGTPKSQPAWRHPIPRKRTSAEVVVTVCPSIGYDTRYSVAPGAEVEGAGFRRAGVGINPLTGKPW